MARRRKKNRKREKVVDVKKEDTGVSALQMGLKALTKVEKNIEGWSRSDDWPRVGLGWGGNPVGLPKGFVSFVEGRDWEKIFEGLPYRMMWNPPPNTLTWMERRLFPGEEEYNPRSLEKILRSVDILIVDMNHPSYKRPWDWGHVLRRLTHLVTGTNKVVAIHRHRHRFRWAEDEVYAMGFEYGLFSGEDKFRFEGRPEPGVYEEEMLTSMHAVEIVTDRLSLSSLKGLRVPISPPPSQEMQENIRQRVRKQVLARKKGLTPKKLV
jgi:hypothetical protein